MNRINLISGDLWVRDDTTVYDLSLGTQSFSIKNSKKNPFTLQIVWAALTGSLNGTAKVYGSNDGVNYDLLTGTASKTLNTAGGSFSFVKDAFEWEWLRLVVTVVGITGGTISANLNIK